MICIADIIRTPTGKRGGLHRGQIPEELTARLLRKLRERNGFLVSGADIILGNSIGTLGNMARNAALRAGFDEQTRASTIDFQCGGTYESLRIGMALCESGAAEFVITGGMESNSLRPQRNYSRDDPRFLEDKELLNAEFSPFHSNDLKTAAEHLSLKYGITKDETHQWTLRSHHLAELISRSSLYLDHVIGFSGGEIDETIRRELSLELLRKASTTNLVDRTNTADFHDGAGVALIASEQTLNRMGIRPLCRIPALKIVGISPDKAPEGCIAAAEALIQEQGIPMDDISLFEINESFAAKPIAFSRHFHVDTSQTNVMGGNLAMGHPFAASGIINILNMVLALKEKRRKFGRVSAGIAGGYGAAVLIENIP